jgi:hypothetical protein
VADPISIEQVAVDLASLTWAGASIGHLIPGT